MARVIRRIENVVELDDHTFWKSRKDLKEFVYHITAHCHHMAGVDKQDISGFKGCEELKWDFLDPLRNQARHSGKALTQDCVGMRLDSGEFAGEAFCVICGDRCGDHTRAESTTNFDNALWLVLPHHAVRHLCIHRFEKSIVPVITCRAGHRLIWEVERYGIFRPHVLCESRLRF